MKWARLRFWLVSPQAHATFRFWFTALKTYLRCSPFIPRSRVTHQPPCGDGGGVPQTFFFFFFFHIHSAQSRFMWYCWGAGLQALKLPQLQGHIFQCAHARTHHQHETERTTYSLMINFFFCTHQTSHSQPMRHMWGDIILKWVFFLSLSRKPWEQTEMYN